MIRLVIIRLVGWGLLPAAAAAASSSEQHGTSSSEQHGTSPPPHQPNRVNIFHSYHYSRAHGSEQSEWKPADHTEMAETVAPRGPRRPAPQ